MYTSKNQESVIYIAAEIRRKVQNFACPKGVVEVTASDEMGLDLEQLLHTLTCFEKCETSLKERG